MSLPTFEPLPEDSGGSAASSRRHRRPMTIPPGASDRGKFIHDLSLQLVPTIDFYLFSLLAGIVLAFALIFDSPALFFLAALVAPFMSPVVGISLGTIAGSASYMIKSIGSFAAGSLIIFACGLLAGMAAVLLPSNSFQQAILHSHFSWPDLVVLLVGAGFSTFSSLRAPNQKPVPASMALAYELYIPIGVAGFGLTSGLTELCSRGSFIFVMYLAWAAFASILVMWIMKLRPLKLVGYVLCGVYASVGLIMIALLTFSASILPPELLTQSPNGQASDGKFIILEPSPTPSQTASPAPSPTVPPPTITSTSTRTLVPTSTPTQTITPEPTPIWARISAREGGGALVRSEPNYNAPVVQSVLNDTLVEVLPETQEEGYVIWVHIQLVDGRDGWVVRDLLRTATPAPGQ